MHEPGEAGVEELLGELLALLDGGGLHDVLLVLLDERSLVRAPVLRGEPRRLARLRLQLRQPRRQSHGDILRPGTRVLRRGTRRVRYSVVRSREAEKNPALIRSAGDGGSPLALGSRSAGQRRSGRTAARARLQVRAWAALRPLPSALW